MRRGTRSKTTSVDTFLAPTTPKKATSYSKRGLKSSSLGRRRTECSSYVQAPSESEREGRGLSQVEAHHHHLLRRFSPFPTACYPSFSLRFYVQAPQKVQLSRRTRESARRRETFRSRFGELDRVVELSQGELDGGGAVSGRSPAGRGLLFSDLEAKVSGRTRGWSEESEFELTCDYRRVRFVLDASRFGNSWVTDEMLSAKHVKSITLICAEEDGAEGRGGESRRLDLIFLSLLADRVSFLSFCPSL